ncbi:aldehyde dehydrogenase family protein [Catenovulum sp. 2E275]|uniref:aldehyde dehydrogenase family protein n=1 Tax=Catenovulum sp. 2E275 TaxID=2980497 RepID=UPI0021CF92C7|nr:aldehyde dehydrogenase family protein [Catenovulum sp. 2E275]MCU4676454.1 aldehyde dehydrogenase family protein [Catenovulum sp. 2E275]
MSIENWNLATEQVKFDVHSVIGGHQYMVESERLFQKVSPVNGKVLPELFCCDQNDVNIAVQSARQAFDKGDWVNMPLEQRKHVLYKFADLIDQHTTELALLDCLEMGKSMFNLINDDVPTCARSIRWFAEALDKNYGFTAPARAGALGTVTYEALGVVGCIVPWNYPLISTAWKIAPALAMGNSVILKPAEQSSFSAIKLAYLALEAGMPAGVLNVITGDGETGKQLAMHNDVNMISFTGSTEVGKLIMQYSGMSNLKKVALECGGKSPFIVLNSSKQLAYAAKSLARHLFFNQGQICSSASRLIVESGVKAELLELIKQQALNYQPADPLNMNNKVGAMVSLDALQKVKSSITQAVEQGAEIYCGGQQVNPVAGGAYFEPTIVTNVTNNMPIAQQEVFGPVLSVITADSAEHALALANDTRYGLAGSVWSDDLTTAHKIAQGIKAGAVHVNCYGEDDLSAPFGGFKQSGMGKDKSIWSLQQYADLKSTWFRLAD